MMERGMTSIASNSLPSAREFLKLSKKHSLVPVYRTVTADLETPVSAFLRIAAEEPEAFLLESVEGGEHVGRYTFIGVQPYKKMVVRGRQITVREGRRESAFEGDIFEELKKALGGHTPARLAGLPPFTAGAVGFFAYDVVRQIERLPSTAKDELGVPDACLMFFDQVLAFDHVKKEIHLIVTADLAREGREGAYERSVRRLNRLEKKLAAALPLRRKKRPEGKLKVSARTPKAAFLRAVEKTKEYIAAGDVFQCVLSQRFDCVPGVDAFEVYRALRIVNPSPYMYFLRFGMEGKKTKAPPLPKEDKRVGRILWGLRRSCLCGCMGGMWSIGRLRGLGRGVRMRWRIGLSRPICVGTRKKLPNTSCWWTLGGMMWAG